MEPKEFIYSEELTDIVERMPRSFAGGIVWLVLFIISALLLSGYFIKYPDVLIGDISISAEQSAIEVVAESSGRLKLYGINSQDSVSAGEILAWFDNPVNPSMVIELKALLNDVHLPLASAHQLYNILPKDRNMGDLNVSYSELLSSLRTLADYQEHKLYDQQEYSLSKVLEEQYGALQTLKEKEVLSEHSLEISDQFIHRYRTLLQKKVISQAEFDQALSTRISVEDQLKTSFRNTSSIRENISTTENSIKQNRISKQEKEQQLNLDVLTKYNNLVDKINVWERKHLICSPIQGKAQFLDFWSENKYVKAGTSVFSIIPSNNTILGKTAVPISGAGKVKVGQRVIVKLADFPYLEYGYINGKVDNISLVSTLKETSDGGTIESYMVTIVFPEGLTTNYGYPLQFKFETKGTVEIITKDRRLLERFFDNLKYLSKQT